MFQRFFSPIYSLSLPSLNTAFGQNKIFNFDEVQLTFFLFMDHAFGIVAKTSSPKPRSLTFSPMLSSGNFILFTCRPMTNFE